MGNSTGEEGGTAPSTRARKTRGLLTLSLLICIGSNVSRGVGIVVGAAERFVVGSVEERLDIGLEQRVDRFDNTMDPSKVPGASKRDPDTR